MLTAAKKQPVLVEVKSGETFNGTLENCDVWMNLHLSDVIKTTADGQRFFVMSELFVRGSNIKYIRLSEEILQAARDYNRKQRAQRRARQQGEGGNASGKAGAGGASFDRQGGSGAARGGAHRAAAGRRPYDNTRSKADGSSSSGGARSPRQ